MLLKANKEIRSAKGSIPNWVIAEKLGVHEVTFIRWMRKELPKKEKERILFAIDEIKAAMKGEE